MRRIHFDNLGKMNYWVMLIFSSLLLFIIGTFKPFDFQNPNIYKYFSSASFLLLAIYYTRIFWRKNYVQSNKKGLITIRLNSLMGKTLIYRDIKSVELNGEQLLVNKNNGTNVEFNLNGIEKSDVKKLYLMINKNIITDNI